tara:strand:+ start:171 stop:845 length:675 start_codon:yes stop_codon:yes gene_type:complete
MRYLILLTLFSFSFSECDQLNQLQCSSDADCEWVESFTTGNCSNLGSNACGATDGCNWSCGFSHGSCYWCCWYECSGGTYEIDNSYCRENPNPPSCSEMNQPQCNNDDDCQWTEDIEWGNCGDYNSGGACDANENCFWDLCYGGWYGSWSHCCRGGSFQIDSSYCETDVMQGDLNGDTTLNVLDVIILVDIILNAESSDLADINGDGMINILDVIELIDIIINQ